MMQVKAMRWMSSLTTRGILARRRPALDHVCIVCKDVRKSVRFYEDLLGAEHLFKDDKHFGFDPAFLRVGQAQIALLPIDTASQTPIRDHNGAHFALSCVDEVDFLAIKDSLGGDLKDAGVTIPVEFYDYGRQWSLFFHDLDSNIVEITHWKTSL
ncbi:Aste57867_22483 [Aphanomyces stellatus]|uniref:Aste57867_22483 protein n=1 Tax=Aphanomyces stellatus TaxID=120398 RepID=A0A485LL21_9STRA|nr:hypothetical protein As57867_022413 [Aphanomyces stellatus]VFT99143.1 Aste57867_22483 [Aphanomyces stellatus]